MKLDKLYDLMSCKFMYRHSTWLLPLPLQKLFVTNNDVHNYETRNKTNPRMRGYVGSFTENSFVIDGPKIWADLPENVKNCDTINVFSNKCKKWLNQSM